MPMKHHIDIMRKNEEDIVQKQNKQTCKLREIKTQQNYKEKTEMGISIELMNTKWDIFKKNHRWCNIRIRYLLNKL